MSRGRASWWWVVTGGLAAAVVVAAIVYAVASDDPKRASPPSVPSRSADDPPRRLDDDVCATVAAVAPLVDHIDAHQRLDSAGGLATYFQYVGEPDDRKVRRALAQVIDAAERERDVGAPVELDDDELAAFRAIDTWVIATCPK